MHLLLRLADRQPTDTEPGPLAERDGALQRTPAKVQVGRTLKHGEQRLSGPGRGGVRPALVEVPSAPFQPGLRALDRSLGRRPIRHAGRALVERHDRVGSQGPLHVDHQLRRNEMS